MNKSIRWLLTLTFLHLITLRRAKWPELSLRLFLRLLYSCFRARASGRRCRPDNTISVLNTVFLPKLLHFYSVALHVWLIFYRIYYQTVLPKTSIDEVKCTVSGLPIISLLHTISFEKNHSLLVFSKRFYNRRFYSVNVQKVLCPPHSPFKTDLKFVW